MKSINVSNAEFKFEMVNEKSAVLQAKNLITNEYENTRLYVFSDDLSLGTSLSDLITKMSELASADKYADLANSGEDVAKLIDSVITAEDEDTRKAITRDATVFANVALVNELSLDCCKLFDTVFGEGILDSVLIARFGRKITPTIVFLIQLVGMISEFSNFFSASALSDSIAKFEKRVKRV